MCGVVGGFGVDVEAGVRAMEHRGPDARGVIRFGKAQDSLAIGATRLAIVDLDPRSDQPFRRGDLVLAYNGELWNWRALRADLEAEGQRFTTEGDTEVVAAALGSWGEAALDRFEGMYAMAWATDGSEVRVARDRFGEVPLYGARGAFASERKVLLAMGLRGAAEVGAGETCSLAPDGRWDVRRYYDPPCERAPLTRDEAAAALRSALETAVREREMSDAPVCTTLSGGVDSSAIAALLARDVPSLVAYTAVLDPRSPDLRAAREVAEYLGIQLREVTITEPSADDLEAVVRSVETSSKAQVEIAWPCVALARAMRADGFKVTFGGEGSDELWASYGFAYHALAAGEDWHRYRKRLFLAQASRNFPRVNKAFMSAGIEARLPFLHRPLVELALSMDRAAVEDRAGDKAVLRLAVADLLPDRVVRRAKLAFQDGLGMKRAAAAAVADPARFYRAVYDSRFG